MTIAVAVAVAADGDAVTMETEEVDPMIDMMLLDDVTVTIMMEDVVEVVEMAAGTTKVQREVDKAINSMTGQHEVDTVAVMAKRKNLKMQQADETIALIIVVMVDHQEEVEDKTIVTTMALDED